MKLREEITSEKQDMDLNSQFCPTPQIRLQTPHTASIAFDEERNSKTVFPGERTWVSYPVMMLARNAMGQEMST